MKMTVVSLENVHIDLKCDETDGKKNNFIHVHRKKYLDKLTNS